MPQRRGKALHDLAGVVFGRDGVVRPPNELGTLRGPVRARVDVFDPDGVALAIDLCILVTLLPAGCCAEIERAHRTRRSPGDDRDGIAAARELGEISLQTTQITEEVAAKVEVMDRVVDQVAAQVIGGPGPMANVNVPSEGGPNSCDCTMARARRYAGAKRFI